MTEPDQSEVITAVIPAADVADPGWRLLAEEARTVSLAAGAVLFKAGDPCREFVIVLGGSIRVQYSDAEGHEIVLYRVRRGETCILTTSCLMGGAAYPAEGLVEEDAKLAVVSLAVFRRALNHEAFRNFVFTTMGRRILDLMLVIDEIAFRRLDHRLAEYLAARGGAVDTTHYQIAVELGSAREVVSRLLKEFERRGWVGLQRGHIEIRDRDALREFSCD